MKKLTDYTDAEKIEKFDEVHSECLEEINNHEGHDEHYFYEGIIATVLGMVDEDWNIHNSGRDLGVVQIPVMYKGDRYYLTKEEYADVTSITEQTELISESEAVGIILVRLGKR